MRQPDTPHERRLFREIFSDPERAADAVRYVLFVGGERLKCRGLVATSTPDAPAVALEADLPAPLPRSAERKPVRVGLHIEGHGWIEYRGRVMVLNEAEDGSGGFGASTPGYYQGGDDSIKFAKNTEYNTTPQKAMRDMLKRFPYTHIKVAPVKSPKFKRVKEETFPLMAPVADGIEAVEEEAGMIQKDTWLGGAEAIVLPKLGGIASRKDAHPWRVGEHLATFSATLKNQARFYDVGIVAQDEETGIYRELVKPRPKVRYFPGIHPPPKHCTYYEEITDDSTLQVKNPRAVRRRAQTLADSFSFGGEHTCTFTTPFIDPRIEDFDVKEIRHHNYETGLTTHWHVLIEGQVRDYVNGNVTYTGTGLILRRRGKQQHRPRVPTRARREPRASDPRRMEPEVLRREPEVTPEREIKRWLTPTLSAPAYSGLYAASGVPISDLATYKIAEVSA